MISKETKQTKNPKPANQAETLQNLKAPIIGNYSKHFTKPIYKIPYTKDLLTSFPIIQYIMSNFKMLYSVLKSIQTQSEETK